MKSLEQWRLSGVDLGKFLQIGDQIDQEFADYFLCVLPPATHRTILIQVGEPHDHIRGRATFPTIYRKGEGSPWVYAGNCYRGEGLEPGEASK